MPNYNSIEGNVLFPTIDGYDMYKAGDMALYLAHCDFYPFKKYSLQGTTQGRYLTGGVPPVRFSM